MTSSNRLLLLFPLLFGIALPLAAQRQLNPTVTVLREATGPVPADCVDERATPAPRVDVAEMQREAATSDRAATERLAPPSADLRGRLRSAQSALAAGDRTSFVAALTSARSTLASYPTGAERDAAAELIRVYEDAARVWDYQFESPTGAFFDESSELFAIASAYPGYREAVRRHVIERGGTRYYPSAETRAFLARAAADRASRLGIRASAATTNTRTTATPSTGGGRTDAARQTPRSTRDTTRDTATRNTATAGSARQPASGTRSTSATAGTRVAGRDRSGTTSPDAAATQRPGRTTTTTSPQATRRAPATSVASAGDRPARPATQRSTSSQPRAAAAGGNAGSGSGTAPSGGSPATSAVSTTPSGGASSPAVSSPTPADTATAAPSPSIEPTVTSTPATPFETTTDTTTTDAATTDTAQTDTTDTTVTATAPERSDTAPATTPAGGKSRSLLWPAVVVLITVGVLVLLFRASD